MTTTWTVAGVLEAARTFIGERGSPTARLDAELLLGRVMDCERLELLLRHDMPLSEDVRARYRELVRRRGGGEPVAYILGEKEFYGISFTVDRRCLIPRPETEHLVDEALLWLRERTGLWADRSRPPRVLDVGTGSGCIPVSLARSFPEIEIFATDVSSEALEIASENISKLAPDAAITLLAGDLVAPARGAAPFDLIVSNPPYIGQSEMAGLPGSVRDHEPFQALCSGDDPLMVCRRVVVEGLPLLASDAAILLELPETGAAPMKSWLQESHGESLEVRTANDLAGIPRVLMIGNDPSRQRFSEESG